MGTSGFLKLCDCTHEFRSNHQKLESAFIGAFN
jgi:hypothetical protein